MQTTAIQKAVAYAGGPSALAKLINRRQSTVWDWLNKPGRRISAETAVDIERATDGHVTAEQLRPDLAKIFRRRAA